MVWTVKPSFELLRSLWPGGPSQVAVKKNTNWENRKKEGTYGLLWRTFFFEVSSCFFFSRFCLEGFCISEKADGITLVLRGG